MLLERLGEAWRALRENLQEEVRVLVVDDEAIVRQVLGDVVEMSGYEAVGVADAESAIEALRSTTFDLLVTDKNLPGYDGIDLIAQARSEGLSIPAILVTAFPSVRTISRALKVGAADYITKPFDDIGQVQRRIESVIEAEHTGKLVGRMVQDLQAVVHAQGVDSETVRGLGQELFAYKHALAMRPEVVVLEPEARMAELTRLFLQNTGLRAQAFASPEALRERAGTLEGPLCVYLSLALPGALDLVGDLLERDPGLEVVVSAPQARLDDAIEAVDRGASDLVLGSTEGLDMMCARVRRAVTRSRRRRLYLHLIATLYRRAREAGTQTTDALLAIVPEAHRAYLDRALSLEPLEAVEVPVETVDLEDLFDEEELVFEITVGPMAEAEHEANLDLRGLDSLDSPEARIARSVAGIDPGRTVEIPLRAAMQVYATLGEFLRFFHDAEALRDPEALRAFLGDAEHGALSALARAYYDDLRAHLPADVRDALGSSDRIGPPLASGERAGGTEGP